MPEWLKDILPDQVHEALAKLPPDFWFAVLEGLLRTAAAVMIFIVGRFAIKIASHVIEKQLRRARVDAALIVFLRNISYAILLTVVIIAALSTLGVQTASFIAVLGAAGLAVGLALQGSLSNFAAGVLLILLRPMRADDIVEMAGVFGRVEAIDIFTTKVTTFDNKLVIIPNSRITNDNIINYTKKAIRRVDIVVGVHYNSDLRQVKDVLMDVITSDPRTLDDPEAMVVVLEFADSSINMGARPWVKTEDYWLFLWDTLHAIKERFDAEDITIPFPQRDVHFFKEEAASEPTGE